MRLYRNQDYSFPVRQALLPVAVMAVAVSAAYGLSALNITQAGILLILQLGVVIVALSSTRFASLLAGLIGALCFNYFFTAPRFSLQMFNAADIFNLMVFLMIAVLTSHLAIQYRHQKQALAQAEMRSRILLSVSHDLRTPLAGIIGNLSTLQEYQSRLPAEDQDELLQSAMTESHRLHRYIENLLQATKLQQGKLQLNTQLQSILPVLGSLIDRVNPERIQLRAATPLPEVSIQHALMEQAIHNILDNALKYALPDTPITVTVGHNQQALRIEIHNQGPVISDQDRDRAFELFFSSRKGDQGDGGTGLGLTVSQGIIQAHQGDIQMQPTDTGCTVCISLPVLRGTPS
ncbi:DUF4118 domain-containing protein (plasmid) [Photobacterium sp. GJ3]|uniref:sensor histidine kinase n=1 Tax=Photobacterium sp. GJ3 TaxID=2829502 RepID=UPI001B8AA608|nr:ATP-binding protein [Photobacterium sp. GJ3]QUJ69926.1 DUF4118 domain-containing protein [Photobacterium sp. GJ3]